MPTAKEKKKISDKKYRERKKDEKNAKKIFHSAFTSFKDEDQTKSSINLFASKFQPSKRAMQAWRLYNEYRHDFDLDMTKGVFYRELNKIFKKRTIRVYNARLGVNSRKVAFLMERK